MSNNNKNCSWSDFGPLPNYERCVRFEIEGKVGLIIIHNTTLGPALGGFRIKKYDSEAGMVADAARLARGMSYKNAASGFDLGGGKAVVNAEPEELTPKFLQKYGEVVEKLGGKYITAPDFGSDIKMMDIISQSTNYIVCLSEKNGGLGDPSPSTARGVFLSILASIPFIFGTKKLTGLKILIQGYGKVGEPLAKSCAEAEAEVLISETDKDKIAVVEKAIKDGYKFQLIKPDLVYTASVDIFSPNATGGVINPDTISSLSKNVKMICGGANNQLASDDRESKLLKKAHLWWVPDFIANAGGVAIAFTEWETRKGDIPYDKTKEKTEERLQKIAKRVRKIMQKAIGRHLTTLQAARELAEETVFDRDKERPIR